jgi:P4 family phage/plasmid primase-like protien
MGTIEDVIRDYGGLGWSLMLLPVGQKKTTQNGWPDDDDDPENLAALAVGGANLAVRLGERSGQLADVDLDQPAARAVARFLLPPTPARFGRDGVAGMTHYLYLAPDGPPRGQRGTMRLNAGGSTDQSVKTYSELRWNGGYTVLPPSLHPEGGLYRWENGSVAPPPPGSPPPVPWSTLAEATREVAAAALLVEAYPELKRLRHRHYTSLALSAALLRAGWPLPRVERFVYACAQAAGDEEAEARVDNARSTAERLAAGEHLGGWSALVSYLGDGLVTRFQRFLGLDPRATGAGSWAGVVSSPVPSSPKAPAAPTTPNQAPAPPGARQAPQQQAAGQPAPTAPVIQTAQQAAQTASQQSKAATLSSNEVALNVAVKLHSKVPIARDEGHQLYHYAGGVYHSRATELYLRERIAVEVLAYGAEYLDKGIEDQVLHRLLVGAAELEEVPNPRLLNLENGVLDLETMVLGPHDPDLRTTLKLPIAYDPAAGCPNIEAFCKQVFPQDAYDAGVPWEVVALCACAVEGIDKAVLLLGEGENGKGIYLDLVLRFVGKANASAVSLQRIGDDRFATADLRGKLLNVCADLPTRRLEDSGDFKIIVSRETIRAQRKNQPAFDFRPFCRLLFSSNNLPESDDASRGYVRRWHIIPFTQTFGPDNPLRRARQLLLAELTTPHELSGLLNRAIPAMLGFLSGAEPTSTPSMDEAIREFGELTDDFSLWLANELRFDITGFVESAEIAGRWRARQDRRRRPGLVTGNRIAKAIKDRFPKAVPDKQRVGGTGTGGILTSSTGSKTGPQRRGYSGVSWRQSW